MLDFLYDPAFGSETFQVWHVIVLVLVIWYLAYHNKLGASVTTTVEDPVSRILDMAEMKGGKMPV